ncbi:hypothetical protein B0T20DRAFT_484209 [Sordaria brevicollis]|uniref:Uncharacterized protein n=1 Tax=Sordaria brevicollis TaxID=83679 RepID=A0AAE0NW22_SORBR|nr:hypothetical protein B0T20DRAFT_484209 [Sordaria brevicollis]
MARKKFTTRKPAAPSQAQPPESIGQPIAEKDVEKASSSEVDDSTENSSVLVPEPAKITVGPVNEAPTVSSPAIKGSKSVKHRKKRIILHFPPARVLRQLDILPVDAIMSDMTDSNGGVPPFNHKIRAEAVRWFKQAYRAGTRIESVRNAAQVILDRLDTVIAGNPAYIHNKPSGEGLERLELQREFVLAILDIRCANFCIHLSDLADTSKKSGVGQGQCSPQETKC